MTHSTHSAPNDIREFMQLRDAAETMSDEDVRRFTFDVQMQLDRHRVSARFTSNDAYVVLTIDGLPFGPRYVSAHDALLDAARVLRFDALGVAHTYIGLGEHSKQQDAQARGELYARFRTKLVDLLRARLSLESSDR